MLDLQSNKVIDRRISRFLMELPRKVGWEPKNLEPLSIDQLEDYISVLEGEIARVRSDMETKKAKIGAAEAFFKK